MKKLLTPALAVVALAAFALVSASPASSQPFGVKYRAGTDSFPIGSDGINITFASPLQSIDYAVVVQQTNTAGYSPTNECTYFNPLHKRVDGFEVQHKRCDDGTPVQLDVGVSLDWIAIQYK